jgi:hypothetical protein
MVWVPLLPAAHRHYRQKQHEVAQDAQPPAAHHPLGARQHDKEAGRESPRIREAAVLLLASTIANGGIMRFLGTLFTHHHHHHHHPSKIPPARSLRLCFSVDAARPRSSWPPPWPVICRSDAHQSPQSSKSDALGKFSSTRPRHLPTPHNPTPREVSEAEIDLPEASPSIPASEHRRRWAAGSLLIWAPSPSALEYILHLVLGLNPVSFCLCWIP